MHVHTSIFSQLTKDKETLKDSKSCFCTFSLILNIKFTVITAAKLGKPNPQRLECFPPDELDDS